MIKGKTKSGFSYIIPEANLDMLFIDALAELNEGEELAFPKLVRLLFRGTDLRQKLYDHCMKEDGTVSPEDISNEITEILESNEKTKNS